MALVPLVKKLIKLGVDDPFEIQSGPETGGGGGTRPPSFTVLMTSTITPLPGVLTYPITNNVNGVLANPFTSFYVQSTGIEITGQDFKPVFDRSNIFTRNEVEAVSYAGGAVTLNYVPTDPFIVHYRYYLDPSNYVDNYTPNDIVTRIESEYSSTTIAKKIAFDSTVTGRYGTTNVQDTLDAIINELTNGFSQQTYFQQKPLEVPNGSRTTFTLPFGHTARNLTVKLNGVAYNPDNIQLSFDKRQFTIINNDHVPKQPSIDILTIDYDRII